MGCGRRHPAEDKTGIVPQGPEDTRVAAKGNRPCPAVERVDGHPGHALNPFAGAGALGTRQGRWLPPPGEGERRPAGPR